MNVVAPTIHADVAVRTDAVAAPDELALMTIATVATPLHRTARGSGPMGIPTFSCATFSCL
ncbi:MAG: hypothetical protein WBF79_06150 [Rhodococcus sp. (in: high G+C Gram-positive bacteria)]